MKLLSCHVENFGKLSDFSYVFEEGLNVFLAENGWGKSTLAAFLKVMFYGFEGENRRNEDGNERLRFRPWGGGTYGGALTFSSGDRVYRMHRSFGARKKEDVFLLFDDATGLPSSDFSEQIGEELFGIDRASFIRTVFWSQQDHETEATTLIQAKIGDIEAEQGDLPDYDRAIRQVRREIERLSPDRSSGQIRKKEARAAVLEAEAARLPQLSRQLEESRNEQLRLSSELDQIRAASRNAALDASPVVTNDNAPLRADLEAGIDESAHRIQTLRRIQRGTIAAGHREREEYLKIKRERAERAQSASLALEGRSRTLKTASIISFAAALLFVILTATGILPLAVGAVVSAALLIAGLYSAFQSASASAEDDSDPDELLSLKEEEDALYSSLQGLSRKMKQTEAQLQEEEGKYRALKAQLRRLPPAISRASVDLTEFDRREEECRRQLQRAEQQSEDLRSQIGESREAAEQLRTLREELETLRLQYDTCVSTAAFLEEARASFNTRYMSPFLRSFRRHYGMLTGESAENLQTDADFGITVLSKGLPRDPSLMSEGTRDLISLCRRMAMIDAMYPGEKPFLVLDDPFSNLDAERVKGGMRFLHNASFEYQILYLTCHASRV